MEKKIQIRMYNDGWIEWMREGSSGWSSCVQVTELIRSYENMNKDAETAYRNGYNDGINDFCREILFKEDNEK